MSTTLLITFLDLPHLKREVNMEAFNSFPYTPNTSDTPLQYSAFETSCGSVCYGL